MKLLFKWFVVVWFNSIYGFLIGYRNQGKEYFLGMFLGVMTWYLIYVFIDYLLIASGKEKESRRLFLSAVIRIPLQLLAVDVFAGIAAVSTLQFLGVVSNANLLVDAYLMTILTGFYLSILCGFIFLLISLAGECLGKRKESNKLFSDTEAAKDSSQ